MKRVSAKLVPRDLSLLQKRRRVAIAKEMLDNVVVAVTFINRIITGDETCAYEHEMETV